MGGLANGPRAAAARLERESQLAANEDVTDSLPTTAVRLSRVPGVAPVTATLANVATYREREQDKTLPEELEPAVVEGVD